MLICLICSNQEIRISSFILHAKKYTDNVIVMGYDCSDNTESLTKKSGAVFHSKDKHLWKSVLSKVHDGTNMIIINVDEDLNLSKLDEILEINNIESNDIEIRFQNNSNTKNILNDSEKSRILVENFDHVSWMFFNNNGIESVILSENRKLDGEIKPNFDFEEKNNVVNNIEKIKHRNSLEKKKNPLIVFGIPGLIMVISSFILVTNVVSKYESIDSISMGTAIITIGSTISGIIFLMMAIISYVLGKQTDFIFTNYSQ